METTTTDAVWREIDGKLLGAALHAAFGTTGDVETTDIDPAFVELLAEYLDEADLFCDHSVGICSCSDLAMLNELRLWLAKLATCPACGGEGIGDMREVHYDDPEFGEWTDYETDPCSTCNGKGTVPL